MAPYTLLQGGTVLTLSEDDKIVPLKNTDLLIQGNKIAKIGSNITAPAGTNVFNCKCKIVSPGFIDTHRHVWQTALKGRHADELLLDYMVTGNKASYSYSPTDVYWGELAGCLEAIDGGTTSIVDFAHMTQNPDNVSNAISATVDSGVRSIFCYSPIPRTTNWTKDKFEMDYDHLPDWLMKQMEELAKSQPFGDGRVTLGLGFDGFFLDKDVVVDFFERVRKWGVKLITIHYVANAVLGGGGSLPKLMNDYGILKDDVLVAHATGASDKDAEILSAAGAFVSTTPDTEYQMGLGNAVGFWPNFKQISSLGVDCHSNNRGDIVTQMHLGLQAARGEYNQKYADKGLQPRKVNVTVEDAFNLGTIQGARAINMEQSIGSLAEGKLADIVIFDGTTPGMLAAAEQDPVAAIVLHSSVRDIDMVIVDGIIRKAKGRLTDTIVKGKATSWDGVAKEVLKSREDINSRIDTVGMEIGRKTLIQVLQIDENKLVE